MATVELISPFSPQECVARLQAATDRETWLARRGTRPVIGQVSEQSLRLRKQINYRNSFQTLLTGAFQPTPGGTLFRGRTGMPMVVVVFMAMWIGLVSFVGIGLITASVTGAVSGSTRLLFLFIPLMMLSFAGGLVWLGRRIARTEEPFLIAFVQETLQGRPVGPHEQRSIL